MESHKERIERREAADRRKERLIAEEMGRSESLSVEGMGLRGRITGHNLVYVVLGIMLVASIVFMIRDHDIRTSERTAMLIQYNQALAEGQRRIIETVGEGNYILLQNEKTRQEMAARIAMPDSLRAKMDRGIR